MNPSTTSPAILQAHSGPPQTPANPTGNEPNGLRSSTSTIMSGVAAGITGVAILAASTWAVIDAAHLQGSNAGLAVALSAGVAVGAAVIGRIKPRGLAAALVLALVAGEASNLIAVAERVVMSRDV